MPARIQHKQLQNFVKEYHEALEFLRMYDALAELKHPKTDNAAVTASLAMSVNLSNAVARLSDGLLSLFTTEMLLDNHNKEPYHVIDEVIRVISDCTCGGHIAIPTERKPLGNLLDLIGHILDNK